MSSTRLSSAKLLDQVRVSRVKYSHISSSILPKKHFSITAAPQPECMDNLGCPNDKTCHNQKCVNPCTLDSCGVNSRCHVQFHRAICICDENHTGNPQQYCRERKFNDVIHKNRKISWLSKFVLSLFSWMSQQRRVPFDTIMYKQRMH